MVRRTVWLSGLVPFARVAEIMAKVGQVALSPSSVWRQAQEWGGKMGQQQEVARAKTSMPSGPGLKRGEVGQSRPRLGVAMDGSLIHIRGEGWKEVKEGCVFAVVPRPTLDEQTGDVIELAHAEQNSYVAHLGGPEEFGELLWAEAQRRGWERAAETEVVGDGAVWVWGLAATHFYRSHQAVDWYHATEHLGTVASMLYGEGSAAAHQFFRRWETPLFQGHAARLAETLRVLAESQPSLAEPLCREAGYFSRNQRRMNYLELRSEGWLIGSGMIESGCKQTKARFAGPGMQWSRVGAQHLLPVRTTIMSERFDELWPSIYNSPPNY